MEKVLDTAWPYGIIGTGGTIDGDVEREIPSSIVSNGFSGVVGDNRAPWSRGAVLCVRDVSVLQV